MSKYAIVETGSKQYWVEPRSVIEVEKLELGDKKQVVLDQVLLFRSGDEIQVGQPTVQGAQVLCDHLGTAKGEKVFALKYRRRKASRTKKGHRQQYSKLLVTDIKS